MLWAKLGKKNSEKLVYFFFFFLCPVKIKNELKERKMKKIFFALLLCVLTAGVANAQIEENKGLKEAVRLDSKRYLLGGSEIHRKEFQSILQKDCPAAYDEYMDAKKKIIGGHIWEGFALGFLAEGLACTLLTNEENEVEMLSASLVGYSCSLVCSVVALVKLLKGDEMEKKSVVIYNESCAKKKYSDGVRLEPSKSGLGLALTF
jgi:hypothetical protein